MANKEKGSEDGNTKIWISRERKELFSWNKNTFSWIFEGYHLVRTWEIDTSLKSIFVAVNCIFWKTGDQFTSILNLFNKLCGLVTSGSSHFVLYISMDLSSW